MAPDGREHARSAARKPAAMRPARWGECGVAPADAVRVADCTLQTLHLPLAVAGEGATVAASVGIAPSVPGRDTPEDLRRRADRALYRAKVGGKAAFTVAE